MQSSLFKESERRNGDGRDIGILVACLLDELFVIETLNNYHRALFGYSEERVAMFNRVAKVLMVTMQDSLLDEITIRLARLIDKQSICGNETFTLRRFDGYSSEAGDPASYDSKLEEAKACIDAAFKDVRNQHLAHLQLDLLADGVRYAYASCSVVQEAIDKCMAFIEEAETQFGITRKYFPNHDEAREVDRFVEVLEKGYEQMVPRKWWKQSKADCDATQTNSDSRR
ncbi:hypothetical protein [Adlercreutzia sp. ZJ304]|uniref:AbiU2 domain-containing protein n=1 Tax=Adlercreutzia sp. ZJ304 TaxID=2709791 RepID=UPI0013EE05E1|nr:hypothetical protein [Adlercreutzia sp. ZJ304]